MNTDVRHSFEEVNHLLEQAATSVSCLSPGSLCRVGGQDLLAVARSLEHVSRLVFAAQICVTDEIAAQSVAASLSSPSTTALLAEQLLIPRREASLRVRTAKAVLSQDSMTGGELDPVLPELGAAVLDGLINPDQVRSVVDTMGKLPSEVDEPTREMCERLMVEAAVVTPPVPFANFCRQVAERLDPDGELPADKARERVELALGRRNARTGLTGFHGQLDDLGVELLGKAIGGLAAPRPAEDGTPDPRTPAVRNGQALIEMLQRYLNLGDAPLDHGVRPHVTVLLELGELTALFDAAVTDNADLAAWSAVYDTGTPITPMMLRLLLCDAVVMPAVLGGYGQILDVGRTQRTFTPTMRKAIEARDRGCTWPGCTRPPSWCDAHHVLWWQRCSATPRSATGPCSAHSTTPRSTAGNGRCGWDPKARSSWPRPGLIRDRRGAATLFTISNPRSLSRRPATAPVQHEHPPTPTVTTTVGDIGVVSGRPA